MASVSRAPIEMFWIACLTSTSLTLTAFAQGLPRDLGSQPCNPYALTGQELPAPIRAAVQLHAIDKRRLLNADTVITLANVFWVIDEKRFADCVFRTKLKTFLTASDANNWWNHIGTGSVMRAPNGRFAFLYINAETIADDMAPYYRSPHLHPEVIYELSALMEFADAVVATQNPSSDPDRGVAFPAQLKLLKIYEHEGKVPLEAIAKVEQTYTIASLNSGHKPPETRTVVTKSLSHTSRR